MSSTALFTDHYELTMLEAALLAGVADQRVTFEVFTRSLPSGRPYGVFCGSGRLIPALENFRFGKPEIDWLRRERVVNESTLEWLAGYRFSGDIHAYGEGDLYCAGSPVLTVEGTFGESVLLETLVLSVLNHDSAVAAAASLICRAAGDRPVIEMGSRRTDNEAAVEAARAAYIGGFASTSNLEAGRRYGVPTAGTTAHAFVQLFPDEKAAFAAQVKAFGSETTLLVDTNDTHEGIRRAVEAAGTELAAIRIDSGDLVEETRRARELLDSLGATETRIVVTGDLDDERIEELRDAPADAYGVGTGVVTGLGSPTAGFIYKLVAVGNRPVAKHSPGKSTVGGRKWAWRVPGRGEEVVSLRPEPVPDGSRPLQHLVMVGGVPQPMPGLAEVREHRRRALDELPAGRPLVGVAPV
ncbi:MAG TPA: nicotinate phosphoribosyltransferase [Acidimicrobiales bacterium]